VKITWLLGRHFACFNVLYLMGIALKRIAQRSGKISTCFGQKVGLVRSERIWLGRNRSDFLTESLVRSEPYLVRTEPDSGPDSVRTERSVRRSQKFSFFPF